MKNTYYISVTTRCNMECTHCCFACTENGEDISVANFQRALKLPLEIVVVGGGEPTVHPNFLEMVDEALKSKSVKVATNGKDKEVTMALVERALEKESLKVTLSLDEWHEDIDPEVKKIFEKERKLKIRRTQPTQLIESGRCKTGNNVLCCCPVLTVNVRGEIKFCGCLDSPKIGTVSRGVYKKYRDFCNKVHQFDYYQCWKRFRKQSA